jgi:hypothetical protein
MTQTTDPRLLGQSIIAEMVNEYNALTEYRTHLPAMVHGWSDFAAKDDAMAELEQQVWLTACRLVARHCGIKLAFNRERIK